MNILRRYSIAEIYFNHISVGPHRCDMRPAQKWSKRDATFLKQALPIQFAHVNAINGQFFNSYSFGSTLHLDASRNPSRV
jgi:hypothetical protein